MPSNNSAIKRVLLISLGCLLAIGILICALMFFNSQKIQNKKIIELTTISDATLIKEILGEEYEDGTYDRDNTKIETYSTITIGSIDVNFATLKYNENEEYETLLIGAGLKKEDIDILKEDFVKTYGKNYDYDKSKDETSYRCFWKIDSNRTISFDVMYTGIGHNPYSVSIISNH